MGFSKLLPLLPAEHRLRRLLPSVCCFVTLGCAQRNYHGGAGASSPQYKDTADAKVRELQESFIKAENLSHTGINDLLNKNYTCRGRKAYGSPQIEQDTWGAEAAAIEQWDKERPLRFERPDAQGSGTGAAAVIEVKSTVCPGKCLGRFFNGVFVAQGRDQFGNWALTFRKIVGQDALIVERNFLGHEEAAAAYDLSQSIVTKRQTAWSYHVCVP